MAPAFRFCLDNSTVSQAYSIRYLFFLLSHIIVQPTPVHNSTYQDAVDYFTLVHRENPNGHYELILDEHGLPQLRENCRTIYINSRGEEAGVEEWARDCRRTNQRYQKNNRKTEVKMHHFILSFPKKDRSKLSEENLEQIARRFVKRYFSGHQALISIHRDTENDHIHVSVNSLRDRPREEQAWMRKSAESDHILPSETAGGCKHQDTCALRIERNEWALQIAREYGLVREDNNQRTVKNREKRFGARNEYLKAACLKCADEATSAEQLRFLLLYRYGVRLIVRGKTVSVQHPDAKKATRLRTLDLTAEDLCKNIVVHRSEEQTAMLYQIGHAFRMSDDVIGGSIAFAEKAGQDLAVMQQYWEAFCKSQKAFWETYHREMRKLYQKQRSLLQQIYGFPYRGGEPELPEELELIFAMLLGGPLLALLCFLMDGLENQNNDSWLQEMALQDLKLQEIQKDIDHKKTALQMVSHRAVDPTLNLEERMELLQTIQRPLEKLLTRIFQRVQYPVLQGAHKNASIQSGKSR